MGYGEAVLCVVIEGQGVCVGCWEILATYSGGEQGFMEVLSLAREATKLCYYLMAKQFLGN